MIPVVAWAAAPVSAGLLGFLLWRGRLAPRLLVDALAVGVTLGAAVAAALAPFDLRTNPLHFSPQTLAFLFAGLPEEGVKLIGVAAFLRPHYLARGRRDVTLAAGALSLGFAGLENLFYLGGAGAGWATLAVERALTAVPFHVFLGLAGGFALSTLRARPRDIALGLAAWLGLAAIHGVYDFAVFSGAGGATPPAWFPRLVAALGLDLSATLHALLAGAEVAAAACAFAALWRLRHIPPAPQGRFAGFARSRAVGRLVGAALAAAAVVLIGAAAFAGVIVDSAATFFALALRGVMPLALGALFAVFPAYPKRPPRFKRRVVWALAGVAVACAVAAAAVWGPAQWRSVVALQWQARAARQAAQGDFDHAIANLDRALPFAPNRAAVLSQRAVAEAAANRFDAALADLDAALKASPDEAGLYFERSEIDRQRNDPRGAVADLDAALRLKAGDPDLLAARGQARLEAGDAKAAYDDLAQASRVAPDNPQVRRAFAVWDVDAGDFDAALRDLNARLHADPGDVAAAFQRGRVWLYKGDAKRALDDFALADRNPQFLYPALWRFLAETRLGGDAKAALERRLGAAPVKWPTPVALMLMGGLSPQSARAAASNDGERCEADFYDVALAVKTTPDEAVVARLRAALAECPPGFIEHEGAKAMLRRFPP